MNRNAHIRVGVIDGGQVQAALLRGGHVLASFTGSAAEVDRWALDNYPGVDIVPVLGNPSETAAETAEEWLGRPPDRTREITERIHVHTTLADLGRLVELEVYILDTKRVNGIGFRPEDGVRLAAAEKRSSGGGVTHQLYFVGGNQEVSPEILRGFGLGEDELSKELIVVGRAHSISYFAKKSQNDWKPAEYIHTFAEKKGLQPTLVYRRRDAHLELVGGSYTIEDVGIVG